MKFETLAIHAGQGPDPAYGAVMTPIYQTSTFAFKGVNAPGPFDYSRSGNPTRKALEDCLAALEGGAHGFAFATGQAAEATLLSQFGPGDHLIAHDDIYGGTYRLLVNLLREKGVPVDFVNLRDLDAFTRAIRVNTRAVWTETPTNPLMNLLDLAAIAAIARHHGLVTVCDNTFLSPYFQRPLDLGIDVVLHSTTKYINGHSDVVGGALITRDPALAERIGFYQNAMGTCAGPQDCFLVLRGVKTLAVRMEAHHRNALGLARWLEAHPKVERVLHPGLESHPQHALARRQMTGSGGTFSFRVQGGQAEAFRLLSHVKLFTLAESLGGVESLIEHPWTMTHVSMPEAVRAAVGITDNLIRVSVGIEHLDDLVADLEQAFAAV
ncbi:MAG TPA: PLP-dependent aspartate aminotransferase family protein [Armatimonadota bacterium]|nr:PLP-dependent aspartate aminotransferase family protein [Armatimonadota bacterium]